MPNALRSCLRICLRFCLHQCRLFFIALQFFTRLPIPRWVGFEASWLHHASRYFPLVGIVVAACSSAIYALASWIWPAPVAALLATIAGIHVTGAFHEDGFADMCDGFGGGMTRERVLEIMKDSRIGAYGAIGIGCLLALKVTLLSLLPPGTAIAALFLAHPLSRLAAASLIWRLEYARADSKAKPLAQEMSGAEFALAAATALLPALILGLGGQLPWRAMAGGALGAALVTLWLARLFIRRLGGYTGDCLGAVQQATEIAFYLAVLAAFRHGAWAWVWA
ncbi:MAG TPA: adenosylcobinamide-GDP ribazoletransferase [Janthinobacterium sp.]|jgi:adenosylcobinamide-GDP ribazoletransferase|nr:adenosylcobinamide-GDP ribazoletransferase [Janthinobacterium sp.]